ncbi:MAG: RIO1 family regulatory kinase/ATPase [Candidatus Micrarchaeia archaeon]
MARLSKRKRPPREIEVLKEQLKIEAGVFDKFTFMDLAALMSQGIIQSLDFPIRRGKESVVFRATPPEGYPTKHLAVKIYNVENSDFKHMTEYIANDPRFQVKKNRRKLVHEWVKKEYRNLLLCEEIGIKVPHPHVFRNNILVMDFIGDDGVPAPTLKEHGPFDPEKDYAYLLNAVEKMYKNGFTHADLSEYNVLCARNGELWIIDLAQGVVKSHPLFERWHERDVQNIHRYFRPFICSANLDRI